MKILKHNRAEAGFNMVEIAICLAVIGFALVSIVGVLPTGTRATKDNREETIIDQDARYFLQVIRSGAQTMNGLETLVQSIDDGTNVYPKPPATYLPAYQVVGLLSTPGRKEAIVRSLAGPLTEKADASREVAFKYRITVDVEAFYSRTNEFPHGPMLSNYLHEVRLRFEWPLRPDGTVGAQPGTGSPKIYRTLVSGALAATNDVKLNRDLYYFRP